MHDTLRLEENDIRMIQIDGPRRRVYIKFWSEEHTHEVYKSTGGQVEYRHENGEISQVNIDIAGMGIKRVRIACLPPEVKESTIKEYMSKFGDVKSIRDEMWTQA